MSEHEHAAAAPDNPKVLIIFVMTVLTLLMIVGIVIGVQQFYEFAIHDQVNEVEMQAVDARLTKLRSTEKHDLTSYQWVDQKAGVVRIPLDQAVELTLRDWKNRPSGMVPGAVGATTPLEPTATPPAPAAPAGAPSAPAEQPK